MLPPLLRSTGTAPSVQAAISRATRRAEDHAFFLHHASHAEILG
jgi:hypothetical protein